MKPFIRVFTFGLLTATILLSITFFLEKDKETVSKELSTEEMITKLENQGYFVTNEDPTSITEEDDTIDMENEQEEVIEKETEEDTDTYNLSIESGMTISEVANYLVAANIIDSQEAFIAYITDNDYGTSIQIGQFELNSDMSTEEIANTIANQN
ncbi:endolytic transglycosylase MltG [Paraliobacillus sediminis]|uniref:endolytic transglycosylase MltG n=1 Tax=Paraliobacillus sediminis TaxID=1885916 RepID=UPI000E3D0409|nr:endolytic transglycosylase MltG [Paraliobacillus sediminis]